MSDDDVVALMMLAARSGASETDAAPTSAFNSIQSKKSTSTDSGAEGAFEGNGLDSLHDISDSDNAIDDIGIDIGMDIAHWDKEMENVLARMDGLSAMPASKADNEKEKDSLASSSLTSHKITTSSSSTLPSS